MTRTGHKVWCVLHNIYNVVKTKGVSYITKITVGQKSTSLYFNSLKREEVKVELNSKEGKHILHNDGFSHFSNRLLSKKKTHDRELQTTLALGSRHLFIYLAVQQLSGGSACHLYCGCLLLPGDWQAVWCSVVLSKKKKKKPERLLTFSAESLRVHETSLGSEQRRDARQRVAASESTGWRSQWSEHNPIKLYPFWCHFSHLR